jgi:enolase-phosphatase E1
MSAARIYLLDVEGTVAPISFVTEQLFPYARAHFEPFLRNAIPEPASLEGERCRLPLAEEVFVNLDLLDLKSENGRETEADAPRILPGDVPISEASLPRILAYIHWLMDRDRKSTALKSLQGKIWKSGFESGELKGTLFADVPAAFACWSQTARVAIYSSGSVEAQQLLFRYSSFGDLTPLIAGYFDTRTGPKRAAASYAAIAAASNVAPGELLFFSDLVAELDAAREAGCGTRLVVRPGNAPVADANGHAVIDSFSVDSFEIDSSAIDSSDDVP